MGLDTDLPKLVEQHQPTAGVTCLLHRKEDNPTLAIYGSIRAGTAFEPADKLGIAELTTRLLIRGTRKLKSLNIANKLESVGATLSFRNAQDNIVFQARTTSPWTHRVLNILSACLTEPAFDRRDVEREKEELLTDIRLRDDDTTRRGMKELHGMVYASRHPYRRDRFGTPASVEKIARSDIVEYFVETGRAAPVVVAFAGKLEKNRTLSWTEKTFEDRQNNPHSGNRIVDTRPIRPGSKEIVMRHKTQSDVIMGAHAVERTHRDYEPLNLLNVILGELGFMGRLGQRVRDREGLAYSCTSFLNSATLGGNWTALAGVNPRNVSKAAGLMREEIDRVCQEPVAAEEIESAKQNQMGSALMELESTDGIARTSHNLSYFQLGLDYYSKRRSLYGKITEPQLQEMAQKYIEPSKLSTVVVGPKNAHSTG
jgi:zinc protease